MSARAFTLEKGSEESPGVECRVWERHPCGLEAACQPITTWGPKETNWPAQIRDISSGGLGLVLGRRFERGAGLSVEIPGDGSGDPEVLLLRVVHVSALPGGRWLLGCSFVSELDEDEVQRILALAGTRQEPEVSKAEPAAKQLVIPEVIFRPAEADGQPMDARAWNLHLKADWPLKPGKLLRVRLGHVDGEPAWFKLRVRSCTQEKGRWVVTYSLVDQPPAGARPFFGSAHRP